MLKNNKKAIILVIIAFLFICIFLGINAFVNNVEYKSYKEFILYKIIIKLLNKFN